MKIKTFLTKYKASNNKEEFVASHIKRKYVPFAEKQANAELIIKVADYDTDARFRPSGTTRYVLSKVSLLRLYTDIERSEDYLNDFDLLNEENIFDMIENCIGPHEINELHFVIRQVLLDTEKIELNLRYGFENLIIKAKSLSEIIDNQVLPIISNYIEEASKGLMKENEN